MNYKRLDELKKGPFIIVTTAGYYRSYCDYNLPILAPVPNADCIIGFIQEDKQ